MSSDELFSFEYLLTFEFLFCMCYSILDCHRLDMDRLKHSILVLKYSNL